MVHMQLSQNSKGDLSSHSIYYMLSYSLPWFSESPNVSPHLLDLPSAEPSYSHPQIIVTMEESLLWSYHD